jgi:hypothetical protein
LRHQVAAGHDPGLFQVVLFEQPVRQFLFRRKKVAFEIERFSFAG